VEVEPILDALTGRHLFEVNGLAIYPFALHRVGVLVGEHGRCVGEYRPGLSRCTRGDGFALDDARRDSPPGEVVGDRAADDPGSDDDDILAC